MKIRNLLGVALIIFMMGIVISTMAQMPDATSLPQNTPTPQKTPVTSLQTPSAPRQKTTDSKQKTTERYSPTRKESGVPKKRSSTRGKSLSYGPTYQPPEFRMQANLNSPVLYFYPSDKSVKVGGGNFITLIVLSNPKGETFDSVFLAVKYNNAVFEPVDYEDNIPSEFFKEQPRVFIYKKEGILTYSAQLAKPFLTVNDELLNISWKALVPQSDSPISFSEFQGKNSGLFKNNVDILGDAAVNNDGVIPAHITVLPESYTAEENEEDVDEYSSEWDMFRKGSEQVVGDGSVVLALKAPDEPLKAGEVFLVDIYFKNPKALPIDNIYLDIRFDPDVLRVVDYDEDNWITRDVNIFDGSSHEKFPFDFLFKNQVFNQTGRIIYKNGISKSDLLIQEGVMATIKFYPLAASDKTTVKFNISPGGRSEESAMVLYMGNNILGTPDDPQAGVFNTELAIHPK
jgi:hypothetical protein